MYCNVPRDALSRKETVFLECSDILATDTEHLDESETSVSCVGMSVSSLIKHERIDRTSIFSFLTIQVRIETGKAIRRRRPSRVRLENGSSYTEGRIMIENSRLCSAA